jgi:hypothetical protein
MERLDNNVQFELKNMGVLLHKGEVVDDYGVEEENYLGPVHVFRLDEDLVKEDEQGSHHAEKGEQVEVFLGGRSDFSLFCYHFIKYCLFQAFSNINNSRAILLL